MTDKRRLWSGLVPIKKSECFFGVQSTPCLWNVQSCLALGIESKVFVKEDCHLRENSNSMCIWFQICGAFDSENCSTHQLVQTCIETLLHSEPMRARREERRCKEFVEQSCQVWSQSDEIEAAALHLFYQMDLQTETHGHVESSFWPVRVVLSIISL